MRQLEFLAIFRGRCQMSQNSGPAAPGRTSTGTATAAAAAQAAAQDPSSASVGELVGLISKDFSTLIRQELDLAKAEVKQEAIKSGKAAGMFGAAGFAGYMVVLFLSIALWWALANGMDEGWAALVVAVIWAVVAAVLYAVGRSKLKNVNPKPERTVETLREVPDALKGR